MVPTHSLESYGDRGGTIIIQPLLIEPQASGFTSTFLEADNFTVSTCTELDASCLQQSVTLINDAQYIKSRS